MNYKIISTDLDGTLLDSDLQISEQNKAAMEQLAQKGVVVAVSTGRSYAEIPKRLREFPTLRYHSSSNGAATFDRDSGKCILSLGIEGEDKKFLLETLRKYHAVFTIHFDGASYFKKEWLDRDFMRSYRMSEQFIQHIYDRQNVIEDFEEFCDRQPIAESCCGFFRNDEDLSACRDAFLAQGNFSISASMPDNLEVYSARAGKGNALLALAEKLGIDAAETIAVGDGTNDADNLQKAGLGLAVSNADPLLLPYADQTICSNDEHIMKYILENIIQ